MNLVLRGSAIFVFLFVIGVYTSFQKQEPVKASRAIASIEKDFNLLSLKELNLLKPSDLKSYLNEISKTLVKSGSLEGVFRQKNKKTASYFNLIEEAYADVFCPVVGLFPSKAANEEDCEFIAAGFRVAEPERSSFDSEGIREGGLYCPSGQQMCNPALVGFDYSGAKPKLRCLPKADMSNENCAKLETSGQQMADSLALLGKANPKFWDGFEEGIKSVCLKDGKFNEDDEGCAYVRTQMNHSTSQYRSKLTREYKDLARDLKSAGTSEQDGKACKQHTATSEDDAIKDPSNFSIPGQKIFVHKGLCWRLPADTIVSRTNPETNELTTDFYFYVPGREDPIIPVAISESGIGESIGGVRSTRKFFNFQCGPCNDAEVIHDCASDQRKPQAERDYERWTFDKWNANKTMPIEDCTKLVSALKVQRIAPTVVEKAEEQGKSFYELRSID